MKTKNWTIITAILFSFFFSISTVESQDFQRSFQNGTYYYSTDLPESSLTFYLFDDGQYSFEKNPTHQLAWSNVPANALVYHANPYEDDEDPDEVAFNVSTKGTSNPTPIHHQLNNDIDLITGWNHMENANNFYILRFENREAYTIDGCIAFHYNALEVGVISSTILDHYNSWVHNREMGTSELLSLGYTHKITWQFNNMAPGEQRFVYIPAQCFMSVFGNVETLVLMDKNTCFQDLNVHTYISGNYSSYTLNSIVANNPHDPNCIITEPEMMVENEDCQLVKYKIYFQNDGEDPAQNVYIRWRQEYPAESIELVWASDTCYMDVFANNQMASITFEDIFLPGTKQDPHPPKYEETIGSVEIHVWYDLSIPQDKCYETKASIRFDDEMPIDVKNEICKSLEYPIEYMSHYNKRCEDVTLEPYYLNRRQYYPPKRPTNLGLTHMEVPEDDLMTVFPTISDGNYRIEVGDGDMENVNVSVYNLQGNHILEQKLDHTGSGSLDLRAYDSGMYFVQILFEGKTEVFKIIRR